MKLKFINQIRRRDTWKFNNSLLTDTQFVNKEKLNINEVITEYEYDPDMDLQNHDKTFRGCNTQVKKDFHGEVQMQNKGDQIIFVFLQIQDHLL